MFLKIGLYVSLIIFGIGLLYKVSTWFRYSVGTGATEINPSQRLLAAIKGIALIILSPKILTLLKVLILDVIFQRRILKESLLRWVMHMCIYGGFMLLLFMHALEVFISAVLFPDYASTLNPFLFLRNLFGVMVIVGLLISVYRRHILKIPRLMTNTMDHYARIILAVIMISGFLLEGTKIVSSTSFQGMIEEYADDPDDEEVVNAIESYWVENFSIVSPNVKGPFEADILEQGKEEHEISCAACHSRPQWAFLSYGVAKAVSPVALGLDRLNVPGLLWYIHFLACFLGLAYLPFSRMFHIIVSPLSLLANAVMENEKSDPANIATRQVMELDACTHCGTCSTQCFMGVTCEVIQNINILPSEKLVSVKKFARGKILEEKDIRSIQEGLYLCSNCQRCTLVCPVGINLQDLWFNAREAFLKKGYADLSVLSVLSFYRGLKKDDIEQEDYKRPVQVAEKAIADEYESLETIDTPIDLDNADTLFKNSLIKSTQGNSFSYCFTCTTCTSACPVVSNYDNALETLDLVPHQVIRSAVLGLPDPAFRSKMLWSCLGCYQCQDACPQGVRVADVFYELKNMAVRQIKGDSTGTGTGEQI